MRSTSLHGEEAHREHRVSLQRHRLPRECVAYIQPCRYDAWLWLPPQDPAAKPPPNRRPLWLPLHCAAARQEASLRFVPRQPNPQKKEQHQENYHASLPASFSPYCSLIKGTKTVQEMLARRGGRGLCVFNAVFVLENLTLGQERDNVKQWHWSSPVDLNVSFFSDQMQASINNQYNSADLVSLR